MDPSQVIGSLTGANSGQGVQGHHHHMSISDQVNSMSSAIDNAVQSGKLTSDQAASMKQELADITKTLSQAQANSSNSNNSTNATGQTGPADALSQLTSDQRKEIFSELQDVRKQLFSAVNPQDATNKTAPTASQTTSNAAVWGQFNIAG